MTPPHHPLIKFLARVAVDEYINRHAAEKNLLIQANDQQIATAQRLDALSNATTYPERPISIIPQRIPDTTEPTLKQEK